MGSLFVSQAPSLCASVCCSEAESQQCHADRGFSGGEICRFGLCNGYDAGSRGNRRTRECLASHGRCPCRMFAGYQIVLPFSVLVRCRWWSPRLGLTKWHLHIRSNQGKLRSAKAELEMLRAPSFKVRLSRPARLPELRAREAVSLRNIENLKCIEMPFSDFRQSLSN